MSETVLGGTLSFLNELGLYDVVLPFLLVFTIVFAILEKTKIFGTEEKDGTKITRKNMNAMTAFVMGFFVIASTKLVSIVNEVASQTFLLLLLVVLFLMLAGVMQKEGDYEMDKKWRNFFMVIVFIALILIFLNSLGWLDDGYDYLVDNWDTEATSAIILLILIVIFISWITRSPSISGQIDKEEKGDS